MKILAAQLNLTIGDLEGNFQLIANKVDSYGNKCDVIVFSELALTGYPPNDLLLRRGFLNQQNDYLTEIVRKTIGKQAAVIIGAATPNPAKVGKPLFNSLLVIKDGRIEAEYHKQLLPTYNVFDENRYFQAGSSNVVENSPFATINKKKVGFLICEDAWNDEAICGRPLYPTNPVEAVLAGKPDFIISINASPSDVLKNQLRYDLYRHISEKGNGVPIVYVNQVGGNDGLVFDGYSFVVAGKRVNSAIGWMPQDHLITDIFNSQTDPITSPPTNPTAAIFQQIKLGLTDYVKKNGFKRVVIGSSGGIDSALTIVLAVEALGKENVTAITMPSVFSSEGSVGDSVKLCKKMEVQLLVRPIKNDMEIDIAEFVNAFGESPSKLTIENMQARQRGRILMEYSNHYGALVLNTGNKSESSVGYCTICGGDTTGGISPIGDLYKDEVYALSKWYNESKGEEFIPKAIIEKEPSAELSPGQKDSDSLPPYPVLDPLLKLYIERDGLTPAEIRECIEKIQDVPLKEIKRVLQMVDKAEFKRRQSPPVIRVHKCSFGFGRNIPIVQKHNVDYSAVL